MQEIINTELIKNIILLHRDNVCMQDKTTETKMTGCLSDMYLVLKLKLILTA